MQEHTYISHFGYIMSMTISGLYQHLPLCGDSDKTDIKKKKKKKKKNECAPSEDSDKPGQADQSLRCPHEESLDP